MSDIFISYSHKDSDYAHTLSESLKLRGFSVWIDDQIDYGTSWPRVIQKRLDNCTALIVVMTPNAYESDWVQNELNRAKRKHKPIFPLLLEGKEPWLTTESIQYIDVRDGNLPPVHFYDILAKSVPRTNKSNITKDANHEPKWNIVSPEQITPKIHIATITPAAFEPETQTKVTQVRPIPLKIILGLAGWAILGPILNKDLTAFNLMCIFPIITMTALWVRATHSNLKTIIFSLLPIYITAGLVEEILMYGGEYSPGTALCGTLSVLLFLVTPIVMLLTRLFDPLRLKKIKKD